MIVSNTQRIGEPMEYYIEWNTDNETDSYNQLIKSAINTSLEILGITILVDLSVMIVDNSEMQSINLEQRNIDAPTDVLSFPMFEFSGFTIEEINETLKNEPKDPESGAIYIGDMVISWEKVIEQALNYNHSLERELAFLVVHSMLHMMGYDHMNESDETKMLTMQTAILNQMGLKR